MSNSHTPSARRSARLTVESLEDRTTPTFVTRVGGEININGTNLPAGGLSIAAGDLFQNQNNGAGSQMDYVTGTGPGTDSLVRVWNSQTGALLSSFDPFPGFKGGVNVAVGDVLGLGTPQIIVTPAANGPPVVAIFNASGTVLNAFFLAGDTTFMGGLNVTVGHVSGTIPTSGFNDSTTNQVTDQIILGTASDASIVAVTNGYGNISSIFQAFPGFTGGVTVAAANLDPTSRTAGPSTSAFDEIIVGAASEMPAVAVYDVWTGAAVERTAFWAFADTFNDGVTVAAGPTSGDGQAQIFVSLLGTSTINVYSGSSDALLNSFSVYPQNYSAGINLVVGYFKPGGYDPSSYSNFETQDLAVVAADGSFQQEPAVFFGERGAAAGLNGPSPSQPYFL